MGDLVRIDARLPSEYEGMLDRIRSSLPAIERDSSCFHKGHSQFMNVTVDMTALSPMRQIKNVLAEIQRTRLALEEAHLSWARTDIDIRELESDKELNEDLGGSDRFADERLLLDLQEAHNRKSNLEDAIQGAVRKLSFMVTQYQTLLEGLGLDRITEEAYEHEEERYHIMTAFKQALIAARPRGGVIDEGNQIYMFELGINGAAAQAEVRDYLAREGKMLSEGKMPTHDMTVEWLEKCADKYAGCAHKFAKRRGYLPLDENSLAQIKG